MRALTPSRKAARIAGRTAKNSPSAAGGSANGTVGWLWFIGILLTAVIAYGPSLRGAFIFDDFHLPFTDPNAATAGASFWIGGVRPVLMFTYWINFAISGTQPYSYHVVNLLLHAATAGLVYFLLRHLLDLARVSLDRGLLAIFGTGLFLLHPLQTESVAYIAGRSEVVAGLFYVAAWLLFLKIFDRATTIPAAIVIMLLAGLAVAGKESAISLPAILFLTDLYWNPAPLMAQIRSRAALYVPIVLGGGLVAVRILHSLTNGTAAGFESAGVGPAMYALTQCRVIAMYIRLFLLPVGQNGDWSLPFFRSLTDHAAWLWVLAIVALVGVIVWSWRRARLFSFGLAAFLILLLPTSSVVPIKDAIAERRMYIPIVGLILALIWGLDYLGSRFRFLRETATLRTITLLILVIAGALSFRRSEAWTGPSAFWADSVRGNPANARAHLGLGAGYLVDGRYGDAVREFQTAQSLGDASDELASNLATAYQFNHQPELAMDQLRKIAHPTASTYIRIGYLQATMADATGALASFDTALRLDPNDATALSYRGTAKMATDDSAGAQADLRRALELDPGNELARKGLASLAVKN